MTQVAEIKSPHEQRLEDNIAGKEDIYRESHKRVFKLLERFDGQKPAIDVERALYFTQSMAETVGQPLVLRWAKALMNVAKNITVMVQDDQLLLGRCGGHDGRYGILYPELDGDFLDIAVRDLPTRPQSPASISPEDAKIVVEQIAPFWKGRTYHEALNKALPAEVHKLTYDDPDGLISRFIVNETSSFRSSIQWVHDYEVVLKRGFNGLKQEMEEMGDAVNTIILAKPGITGYWQVNGRSDVTFENRLIMDCWYIGNWSFWLDLVLLLKTIGIVLDKKGAK